MQLGIDPVTGLVDEFEGVTAVPMHEPIAIRNAAVTHEDKDLVDRFWVLGKVVPKHGGVVIMVQMRGRISLLGMNEVWELGWIS